jgi:hypothetical protein
MGTIKLSVLFVAAAFVAVAAWQSSGVLQRSSPQPDDEAGSGWLDVASGALVVMPVLVVLLMALVIGLVIQDAYLIRTAHTFFLLGLWMSAALALLAIPASVRQHTPSYLAMVDVVVAALAAVYFTPISHFVDALPPVSPIAPLIAGLGVVAVAYAALYRLRKALSGQPASRPNRLTRHGPSPDTGPQ